MVEPIGFSEDTRPKEDWRESGLVCPYEHRIDEAPTSGGVWRCPVFGHDCPGGPAQVERCDDEAVWRRIFTNTA